MTHELWHDLRTSRYGHGSDGKGGGWEGLAQVLCIRTTRVYLERPGKPPTVESHYYLSSLRPDRPDGSPEALLVLARQHWSIENGLHHPKDRTLREDDQTTRRGAGVYARLRSLVVGLLPYVDGASTGLRQITIQSNLRKALRLLDRKRFPPIKKCYL